MATARPFAYNPGTSIPGTEQVGSLAIGAPTSGFTNNPQFWNGPDEDLGYVIAAPVSGDTQPTEIPGVFASLGFYRTSGFSDSGFINLSQSVSSAYGTPQTFSSATDASTWLTTNGFWNSYVASLCDSFTFIGNNATTTSNSAINDGTSGWDSSAYSLQTFTGPVSVTFQTSANGNILMGGFSYNPTATPGSTYEDTSYGIYLYNSDQIEIYENGGQVAVLNVGSVVSSSDVWEVDYDGTSVKYYYNSTLLYTSTNAVTQPLHVFFPLFTPNEGAVDICVIGTLSTTPTPTPTLTQTPTPTVTETPTGTPSETPTNTPTPTSTDLSSITTFTISGCTNLNVLVADLGPSSLAPGDVFNFTFTGSTPSGCYRIVEKTVATPTDGAVPLLFYVSCAACEASLVTPTPTATPTTTSTPTPSVTNTQTPTNTGTSTPTPTPTPTSGATGNFNVSVSQVGPDVVWSGSGSFNLTSLTLNQNIPGITGGFNRDFAQFIVGPTSPSAGTTYSGSSFTTFPTSFGSGSGFPPSSSSGSLFGVVQTVGGGPREVAVPQGYVSGTVISGSMTYNSQTIAGMGLSGGTYTWAWGSGGNASSLVMTITP
jgi:hypothetical protein